MLKVLLPLLLLCASCTAFPAKPLPSAAKPTSTQQRSSDLEVTSIISVNDETRFTAKNPNVKLVPLTKVKHGKGNIVFSSGSRISGDKLLTNNYDEESFTKAVDTEVLMTYPASSGSTLSRVEIYVDSSSNEADAYFTDGGIGKTSATILLNSDQTRTFSYEAFFYGY